MVSPTLNCLFSAFESLRKRKKLIKIYFYGYSKTLNVANMFE